MCCCRYVKPMEKLGDVHSYVLKTHNFSKLSKRNRVTICGGLADPTITLHCVEITGLLWQVSPFYCNTIQRFLFLRDFRGINCFSFTNMSVFLHHYLCNGHVDISAISRSLKGQQEYESTAMFAALGTQWCCEPTLTLLSLAC